MFRATGAMGASRTLEAGHPVKATAPFPLGGDITHRKAAGEAGRCATVGTADLQ